MRKIVCAAIRFDLVFSLPRPNRHYDIMKSMETQGMFTPSFLEHHVHGFLDSEGNFLTREEAAVVAIQARQLLIPNSLPKGLTTEHLW